MKKISEYLYTYTPQIDEREEADWSGEKPKIKALLLGNSGSGKTSLINVLSNKKY